MIVKNIKKILVFAIASVVFVFIIYLFDFLRPKWNLLYETKSPTSKYTVVVEYHGRLWDTEIRVLQKRFLFNRILLDEYVLRDCGSVSEENAKVIWENNDAISVVLSGGEEEGQKTFIYYLGEN